MLKVLKRIVALGLLLALVVDPVTAAGFAGGMPSSAAHQDPRFMASISSQALIAQRVFHLRQAINRKFNSTFIHRFPRLSAIPWRHIQVGGVVAFLSLILPSLASAGTRTYEAVRQAVPGTEGLDVHITELVYTVQKNDVLERIGRAFKLPWHEIVEQNPDVIMRVVDGSPVIHPGMKLVLPDTLQVGEAIHQSIAQVHATGVPDISAFSADPFWMGVGIVIIAGALTLGAMDFIKTWPIFREEYKKNPIHFPSVPSASVLTEGVNRLALQIKLYRSILSERYFQKQSAAPASSKPEVPPTPTPSVVYDLPSADDVQRPTKVSNSKRRKDPMRIRGVGLADLQAEWKRVRAKVYANEELAKQAHDNFKKLVQDTAARQADLSLPWRRFMIEMEKPLRVAVVKETGARKTVRKTSVRNRNQLKLFGKPQRQDEKEKADPRRGLPKDIKESPVRILPPEGDPIPSTRIENDLVIEPETKPVVDAEPENSVPPPKSELPSVRSDAQDQSPVESLPEAVEPTDPSVDAGVAIDARFVGDLTKFKEGWKTAPGTVEEVQKFFEEFKARAVHEKIQHLNTVQAGLISFERFVNELKVPEVTAPVAKVSRLPRFRQMVSARTSATMQQIQQMLPKRQEKSTVDLVAVQARNKLQILYDYILWVQSKKEAFTIQEVIGLRGMAEQISKENVAYLAKKYPGDIKKHNLVTIGADKLYKGIWSGANNLSKEQKDQVLGISKVGKDDLIAFAIGLIDEIIALDRQDLTLKSDERFTVFQQNRENFAGYFIPLPSTHLKPDVPKPEDLQNEIVPSVRELRTDGSYATVSGSPDQMEFWTKFDQLVARARQLQSPNILVHQPEVLIQSYIARKQILEADAKEAQREALEISSAMDQVLASDGPVHQAVTEIPAELEKDFEDLFKDIKGVKKYSREGYEEFKVRLDDVIQKYAKTGRRINRTGAGADPYQKIYSLVSVQLVNYREALVKRQLALIEKTRNRYHSITSDNKDEFQKAILSLESVAESEGVLNSPAVKMKLHELRSRAGMSMSVVTVTPPSQPALEPQEADTEVKVTQQLPPPSADPASVEHTLSAAGPASDRSIQGIMTRTTVALIGLAVGFSVLQATDAEAGTLLASASQNTWLSFEFLAFGGILGRFLFRRAGKEPSPVGQMAKISIVLAVVIPLIVIGYAKVLSSGSLFSSYAMTALVIAAAGMGLLYAFNFMRERYYRTAESQNKPGATVPVSRGLKVPDVHSEIARALERFASNSPTVHNFNILNSAIKDLPEVMERRGASKEDVAAAKEQVKQALAKAQEKFGDKAKSQIEENDAVAKTPRRSIIPGAYTGVQEVLNIIQQKANELRQKDRTMEEPFKGFVTQSRIILREATQSGVLSQTQIDEVNTAIVHHARLYFGYANLDSDLQHRLETFLSKVDDETNMDSEDGPGDKPSPKVKRFPNRPREAVSPLYLIPPIIALFDGSSAFGSLAGFTLAEWAYVLTPPLLIYGLVRSMTGAFDSGRIPYTQLGIGLAGLALYPFLMTVDSFHWLTAGYVGLSWVLLLGWSSNWKLNVNRQNDVHWKSRWGLALYPLGMIALTALLLAVQSGGSERPTTVTQLPTVPTITLPATPENVETSKPATPAMTVPVAPEIPAPVLAPQVAETKPEIETAKPEPPAPTPARGRNVLRDIPLDEDGSFRATVHGVPNGQHVMFRLEPGGAIGFASRNGNSYKFILDQTMKEKLKGATSVTLRAVTPGAQLTLNSDSDGAMINRVKGVWGVVRNMIDPPVHAQEDSERAEIPVVSEMQAVELSRQPIKAEVTTKKRDGISGKQTVVKGHEHSHFFTEEDLQGRLPGQLIVALPPQGVQTTTFVRYMADGKLFGMKLIFVEGRAALRGIEDLEFPRSVSGLNRGRPNEPIVLQFPVKQAQGGIRLDVETDAIAGQAVIVTASVTRTSPSVTSARPSLIGKLADAISPTLYAQESGWYPKTEQPYLRWDLLERAQLGNLNAARRAIDAAGLMHLEHPEWSEAASQENANLRSDPQFETLSYIEIALRAEADPRNKVEEIVNSRSLINRRAAAEYIRTLAHEALGEHDLAVDHAGILLQHYSFGLVESNGEVWSPAARLVNENPALAEAALGSMLRVDVEVRNNGSRFDVIVAQLKESLSYVLGPPGVIALLGLMGIIVWTVWKSLRHYLTRKILGDDDKPFRRHDARVQASA